MPTGIYIYIYTWVWWGRWKERDSGLVRIVSRFSQSPKSGRQIQVIMARCPFLPCFVPGHLPWSESLVLADPYLQWFEGKILYSHSCTLSWCSEVKLKTKLPTHWSAREKCTECSHHQLGKHGYTKPSGGWDRANPLEARAKNGYTRLPS